MFYTCVYELEGIWGPCGFVATTRDEVVEVAKSMAQLALDQMDDAVSTYEWYDLNGNAADPRALLNSNDVDELVGIVAQISDSMKGSREGYIDLSEFKDIFELIESHKVDSWCSPELRDQIASVRQAYFGLMHDLNEAWE